MRQAIIDHASRRDQGQHPGLLLHRFLTAQATGMDGAPEERRVLLRAAALSGRGTSLVDIYARAYARWKDNLPKAPEGVVTDAVLRTAGRLIVGLGDESVLETGLRLHHTYGVPLIPGSALKGLTSHFCDRVWGQKHQSNDAPVENKPFRGRADYHALLFGNTDDGGVIRFEDAWILPESLTAQSEGLVQDVMTPHHTKWQTDPSVPPTDFDSPNPIPYLSVVGRFHVAVSWQGPDHPEAWKWTGMAFRILREGLQQWGVGGKTSSGYGRLIDPADAPAGQPLAGSATRQGQQPGAVKVKVIERRDSGGHPGFKVQEEGKPPGMLMYGTPPATLPQVGETATVFRNNADPRSPQYRWDLPAPPRTGGPGKKRPRR